MVLSFSPNPLIIYADILIDTDIIGQILPTNRVYYE